MGVKFAVFTLDQLVGLFVENLNLQDGSKIKGHKYWYDQDRNEIVIKVVTASAPQVEDEENDDDPGNGGLPVRHRGPRVR